MQILFDRGPAGSVNKRRDLSLVDGMQVGYVITVDQKKDLLVIWYNGEQVAIFDKEKIT